MLAKDIEEAKRRAWFKRELETPASRVRHVIEERLGVRLPPSQAKPPPRVVDPKQVASDLQGELRKAGIIKTPQEV